MILLIKQWKCILFLMQMTNPTSLSPAAQAVLDAFRAVPDLRDCPSIAAALRAVADQVAPQTEAMPQQDLASRREAMVWGMVNQTQVTRHQLLAIADELEGAQ